MDWEKNSARNNPHLFIPLRSFWVFCLAKEKICVSREERSQNTAANMYVGSNVLHLNAYFHI